MCTWVGFGLAWNERTKPKDEVGLEVVKQKSWKTGISWTSAAEMLRCGVNAADVLGALNVFIPFSAVSFNICISHLLLPLSPVILFLGIQIFLATLYVFWQL